MHTSEKGVPIVPKYIQFIGFDNQLPRIPQVSNRASTERFRSTDKLPVKFRGQPEMTAIQIGETASRILENQTLRNLFTNATRNTDRRLTLLALSLHATLRILSPYYKKEEIFFPQQNPAVIELVTKLFTHTFPVDSATLYQLLGEAEMYGAIHRFCTQTVPEGLSYNFAAENSVNNQINKQLPHSLKRIIPKGIQTGLVEIDSSYFSKEKKWIANDRETRMQLAQEMKAYLVEYLNNNPDKEVSVIEPGGGNAEFSVILAQLLEEDDITRGKVNIIIKELSSQMVQEGKDKIAQITREKQVQSNTSPDYKIHYIGGSAITPLADQINKITQLVASHNEAQLKTEFFISMAEAEKLLQQCTNTPVVAAISTYTFGAMGENAVAIVEQTQRDVIQNGLLLFCDFAERPPHEYSHSPILAQEERDRLATLVKVYDDYSTLGLKQGLATNYALWRHDVMQIWNVYTQLAKQSQKTDSNSAASSTIDLKPFAFLPLKKNKEKITTLVIPGYFEMIIRAKGIGSNDALIAV